MFQTKGCLEFGKLGFGICLAPSLIGIGRAIPVGLGFSAWDLGFKFILSEQCQ